MNKAFDKSITVNNILKVTQSINGDNVFQKNFIDILKNEAVKYQTTFEFLYAPVMGAISHLLGHAYVIPYDEVRKYKFTSFSGLIAHSGTGKSPAFLCVTNSLLEIEIVEQITAERSSIFTQLSDKKFVDKLIKNKRLYGMIDENMNSTNGCAYDFFKIYNNECFGAFQSLINNERYVTFSNPVVTISEASLNLCISVHPEDIINKLHYIREHNINHFLIKCLFIAPNVKTQIANKQSSNYTRLHALFYLIFKQHEREIEYCFSEVARDILIHNISQLETIRANGMSNFDTTLMCIIGIAIAIMPKLCMITKAIHNATNQLEKLISAEQNHISHDFIQDCERIIGNNNDAGFIINDEDIFHGLKFFDYLFKHKLALFSYKCAPNLSFIENLQTILNDF